MTDITIGGMVVAWGDDRPRRDLVPPPPPPDPVVADEMCPICGVSRAGVDGICGRGKCLARLMTPSCVCCNHKARVGLTCGRRRCRDLVEG